MGRRLCDMMGSLKDVCVSILRKEGPVVFEKLVNRLVSIGLVHSYSISNKFTYIVTHQDTKKCK